jgi:tRNA A37 threonylcarbamoyladenosine dehydratase
VVRHGHLNNLAKSNGNTMTHPILVTGAAGRVGGVGGLAVEALQRRDLPEFLVVIEIVAVKA